MTVMLRELAAMRMYMILLLADMQLVIESDYLAFMMEATPC